MKRSNNVFELRFNAIWRFIRLKKNNLMQQFLLLFIQHKFSSKKNISTGNILVCNIK